MRFHCLEKASAAPLNSFKEDIGCILAELLYGGPLRLPGNFQEVFIRILSGRVSLTCALPPAISLPLL